MKKRKMTIDYLTKNILTVFGLVLVWRGSWYILDSLDKYLFGGSAMWTALVGFLIGILILYVPDHDLKEIEKL